MQVRCLLLFPGFKLIVQGQEITQSDAEWFGSFHEARFVSSFWLFETIHGKERGVNKSTWWVNKSTCHHHPCHPHVPVGVCGFLLSFQDPLWTVVMLFHDMAHIENDNIVRPHQDRWTRTLLGFFAMSRPIPHPTPDVASRRLRRNGISLHLRHVCSTPPTVRYITVCTVGSRLSPGGAFVADPGPH